MKLYIELYFSSDGTEPMKVIKKLKDIGFDPVVGEYDFAKDYETPDEYSQIVDKLARSLRDTGVNYRLITRRK